MSHSDSSQSEKLHRPFDPETATKSAVEKEREQEKRNDDFSDGVKAIDKLHRISSHPGLQHQWEAVGGDRQRCKACRAMWHQTVSADATTPYDSICPGWVVEENMKKAEPQDHAPLDALRESAAANKGKYNYDSPNAAVLETFVSPHPPTAPGKMAIVIKVPEFTCLCPITGQPDFAQFIIEYVPNYACVESKSLKLYMMGYRQHGTFHEACTERIFQDLMALLKPQWLRVQGQFSARGGLPFWPCCEFGKRYD